jgi:hypothetical protein
MVSAWEPNFQGSRVRSTHHCGSLSPPVLVSNFPGKLQLPLKPGQPRGRLGLAKPELGGQVRSQAEFGNEGDSSFYDLGCNFSIASLIFFNGGMHLTLVTPICSILPHGGISQDRAGI